ncbi:MAG TPA: SRPBCC domain-containing protein, partial [Cyclobacteriaceae bacterium]|nr:SRPBCC domain-containing protein [Cyclobacteriaceae bacterium]
VGSPIVIGGFHHAKFENRGVVVNYEPYNLIRYTHLSSISRLKDLPENYTVITFTLEPCDLHTLLTTHVEGFANESIYKHLNLYWLTTPTVIKTLVEGRLQPR